MTFPIHSIKHVMASHRKYQLFTVVFAVITLAAALAAAVSSIQLSKLEKQRTEEIKHKVVGTSTPEKLPAAADTAARKEIEALKSELDREKSTSTKMKAKIKDLNNQISALKKASVAAKSSNPKAPPVPKPETATTPSPDPAAATAPPQQNETVVQTPPPAAPQPEAKPPADPPPSPKTESKIAPNPTTPAVERPSKTDTGAAPQPAAAKTPEAPDNEVVPKKVKSIEGHNPAPVPEAQQPVTAPPDQPPVADPPTEAQPALEPEKE